MSRITADPPQPGLEPNPPSPGPDACEVSYAEPALLDALRPRLVGMENAATLAATFAVLGDPTRVRLLDALAQAELCVCELAGLVGLTESAVSHQLRLLRSLRLVRSRRAGRMVYYALDDDHIKTLLLQGRRHIEEAEEGGTRKEEGGRRKEEVGRTPAAPVARRPS